MKDELNELGYTSLYQIKEKGTSEGLVTAFRKDVFVLEESESLSINRMMHKKAEELGIQSDAIQHLERDSVSLITKLRHGPTSKALFVCK